MLTLDSFKTYMKELLVWNDRFYLLRRTLFMFFMVFFSNLGHANWLDGNVEPFSSSSGLDENLFVIHGSNTLGARLLPELVKAYLGRKGVENIRVRPLAINEVVVAGLVSGKTVKVVIEAHGSGTGFEGLNKGLADFGASSRRISDTEVTSLKRIGSMRNRNSEHVLAIDGIAIVVNSESNLREMSIPQVASIFSGESRNWASVGARPGRVTVFARDVASGTWDTFNNLVLKKKVPLLTTAQRFESNDQVSQMVSQSRFSVGFVGIDSIGENKVIALNSDGDQAIPPSGLTLATEDYPLSRRLYLYSAEARKNLANEFLEFALSNPGQQIVDAVGFVSQRVREVDFNVKQLPQSYRELVVGHKRLSLNFRFKKNTADMDGKAERDVERLAHFMKTKGKGRSLLLVGFDNRQEIASRSKIVSKLRALNVKRRISSLGVNAKVASLGDQFLIADPNTNEGRVKNQRVEVWLK